MAWLWWSFSVQKHSPDSALHSLRGKNDANEADMALFLCSSSVRKHSPDSALHSVRKKSPSGENAADMTPLWCPSSVRMHSSASGYRGEPDAATAPVEHGLQTCADTTTSIVFFGGGA